MAHKWTVIEKVFDKDGNLLRKTNRLGNYRTLREALERFGFVDGNGTLWHQFYEGRFDSRNFFYKRDPDGSEWQIWFERIY